MWYPLEWVIYDVDEAGKRLWSDLEQLIFDKLDARVPTGNSKFKIQNFAIC